MPIHRPHVHSTAPAVAAVLAAMCGFMGGASLAKGLFPVAGPAGTAALRLALAALILGVLHRPWRRVPAGGGWTALLIYGLALAGMNVCIYQAIARIPLGAAVALEFAGPLAVALATSRRPADLAWTVLAAGGLALLLPSPRAAGGVDPVGAGFALAAGACWAAYILAGRRAGAAAPGGAAVALGMAVAAVVALPFGAAEAGSALLSPAVLPFGLAVAVLASVVPYSLEMYALRRLPPATFGVLMSLEPAVGAVAGFVLLDERLGWAGWAGVGGVVLASAESAATARARPVVAPDGPG